MRNYRKFLKSITDMSNRDMIKACRDAGLKELGKGSTRIVFELTDKLVIKIALGKAGVEQNKNESQYWVMIDYDFSGLKQYFAKVHINDCHWYDYFLVMDKLQTKFDDKRKYTKTINDAWYGRENPKSKTFIDRALKLRKAVKRVDDIQDAVNWKDIHAGNIGIDGKGLVKIMDYGLTNRTHRKHYYAGHGALARRVRPRKHYLPAV